MTKLNKYDSPVIKVVAFKVEDGFGSIEQNGEATNVINFGGSESTGLISHDTYSDHSGLGQYGYDNTLFGNN